MKKLFLFSVIAFALSTVSCEKGQLKDLENPKFEELNNGEINSEKEPDEQDGILASEVQIPSHG